MEQSAIAFDAFVVSRGRRLVAQATYVCGDVHTAEDVVQEALVRCYPRWKRLCRKGDPYPYVSRAVVNAAVDAWRVRGRRREELSDVAPEDGAEDPDVLDVPGLLRLLEPLSGQERAVVVLRHLEDQSEAQTAAVLGVAVGTVKTLNHRAMAKLRRPDPQLVPVEDARPGGGEP